MNKYDWTIIGEDIDSDSGRAETLEAAKAAAENKAATLWPSHPRLKLNVQTPDGVLWEMNTDHNWKQVRP